MCYGMGCGFERWDGSCGGCPGRDCPKDDEEDPYTWEDEFWDAVDRAYDAAEDDRMKAMDSHD